MSGLVHALASYATTLRVSRMSRPAFVRWQARQMQAWLARDLRRVAFYHDAPPQLEALPIIDKAQVMASFDDFNLGRISAEQGWQALAGSAGLDGVDVGASTGTSGNRTLYAVTTAERYRWLGAMLAKTVPGFFLKPERVAVILPQSSALYEAAKQSSLLRLAFFDLRLGPEAWRADLEAFEPTTIIAPPRLLRYLAEQGPRLAPRRLYAGAETLDTVDRAVIEARFDLPLGQIYMASEGLFAVSCRHHRLHLAEDSTHFEFEPVSDGLMSPLVTSFQRRFQIMARYRMNDLLRLSDQACPCGSPLRVVKEVVGRMDDAFEIAGQLLTPDILRNAVLDASRQIDDFRILRDGERRIVLTLKPEVQADEAEAARAALLQLFDQRGLHDLELVLCSAPLLLDPSRKLRRIENRWTPSA